MKCLKCENEEFNIEKVQFSPEIKGQKLSIKSDAYVCNNCGYKVTDTGQMNKIRKLATDKYRELSDLLTSVQIKRYRKSLDMNQVQFADYLNVGLASVKRWETYFIQDQSHDQLIRLMCDKAYAEFNSLKVNWSTKPEIYNGYRMFNWEIFKQTVLYFINIFQSQLYINKALYYADFKHFRDYGKSITGTMYSKLDYGACPEGYYRMYKAMINEKCIRIEGGYKLLALTGFESKVFIDESFMNTLEFINEIGRKNGKKYLLNLSHDEKGYKNTQYYQPISYDYAESLLIK